MRFPSDDGGGLEFRGTQATIKLDFAAVRHVSRGTEAGQNPFQRGHSFRDGNH